MRLMLMAWKHWPKRRPVSENLSRDLVRTRSPLVRWRSVRKFVEPWMAEHKRPWKARALSGKARPPCSKHRSSRLGGSLPPKPTPNCLINQPPAQGLNPTFPPAAGFPGKVELVAGHHRMGRQTNEVFGILPGTQHIVVGQGDTLVEPRGLQRQQHVAEMLNTGSRRQRLPHIPKPRLPVTGGFVEDAVGR